MPEDSPEEIAAKRRRFAAGRADPRSWAVQIAADLYTAAFLMPKTGGVPVNRQTVTIPTTAHVWDALASRTVYGPLVGRAQDLAGQAHAFHWPLEFPDVMAAGGFDVVLGNPPWERIKLEEQEFFAARDPEIVEAPNAAARGRLIEKRKQAEPGTRERAIYDEFEAAKRIAEASSEFARVPKGDSGRFPLTGRGNVNTYALFAELFANLTGPRGRAGVIVPTGIATDSTTAPFFASLVEGKRLAQLTDFENRERVFPAIDSRIKFSLLIMGRDVIRPGFTFFLTDPSQVNEAERRFTLSAADIARINPNTKTAAVFRSRTDAELTARIYAHVPVLIDVAKGPAGNPWGITVHTRIWHMAEDSEWFRTLAELRAEGYVRQGIRWTNRSSDLAGTAYIPLYEAKMIHQFDHRWATHDGTESRDVTVVEKSDPSFEANPRYWIPEQEVANRFACVGWDHNWLIGWRDITNATNERTVIAAVLPRLGVGNNMPLMFFEPQTEPPKLAALIGSFSSITCDFFARHKIGGTHLNYFIFQQLAVLPPSSYIAADLAFIVPRVLELTYTSHGMAPFARDLGYDGPPFAWDEGRRAHLRADLDAWYARAYGLTRDELRYILDPADVKGSDYPSETFRVLKKNDIARYGEYRTARLVLAAWDAQEAASLRKTA